jgi:NADPH-dependent FMN reductase
LNALIMDGSAAGDAAAAAVKATLIECLRAAGWQLDDWPLRDTRIAPCDGDFGCWIKTPGRCVHADAGREVSPRMMAADLVVLFTRVTFGGFSYELKKAVDHAIPALTPWLNSQGGTTGHLNRYERTPALVGVGLVTDAHGEPARLFAAQVARMASNLSPSSGRAVLVDPQAGVEQLRGTFATAFDAATAEVA